MWWNRRWCARPSGCWRSRPGCATMPAPPPTVRVRDDSETPGAPEYARVTPGGGEQEGVVVGLGMAPGANIGEGATIFGAIFLVLFLALGVPWPSLLWGK